MIFSYYAQSEAMVYIPEAEQYRTCAGKESAHSPTTELVGDSERTKNCLHRYAAATYAGIKALTFPTGLLSDRINTTAITDAQLKSKERVTRVTSPTDVALGLISTIAARDLGFISPEQACAELETTLDSLQKMDRLHGFFLNWYNPETRDRIVQWPGSDKPQLQFLSSIDNAWLMSALLLIKEAEKELAPQCDALLREMNLGFFFNQETNTFRVGYVANDSDFQPIQDPPAIHSEQFTAGCYDALVSETRLISYIAIALGQVPPQHYFHLDRTPDPSNVLQTQTPIGDVNQYLGVTVFNGYYLDQLGNPILPANVGAAFEFWSLPLLINEMKLAPNSWRENHRRVLAAQVKKAEANQQKVWGWTTGDAEDGYFEIGDPSLATWQNEQSNRHQHIINPSAAFLALAIDPALAVENLQRIEAAFPEVFDDRLGFFDGVNTETLQPINSVLGLDAGWSLLATYNAVSDNALHGYFSQTAESLGPILAMEYFFAKNVSEK